VWLSQSPGPCFLHSGQSVCWRSVHLALSYSSPLWAISVKKSSLPTLSLRPGQCFPLWAISEPQYKGCSPAANCGQSQSPAPNCGLSQSPSPCFPLWAICQLALGASVGRFLSFSSPLWAISIKKWCLPTLSQSPSPYFHLWRISES